MKSSPNHLYWLEAKHYTIERTNSPMTAFGQRNFGLFRRRMRESFTIMDNDSVTLDTNGHVKTSRDGSY
ncbi:hypothetical protein E4U48_001502 [Claviceps purpurea]|nr:hypothetical protein E4U48_001502 [Claviceps purpurea]